MKNFLASAMIVISAVLFVQPTIASASQVHWPWSRHHHRHHNNNRNKQCKQSCKDEYNRCKRNHGRHCKEMRKDCERNCPH